MVEPVILESSSSTVTPTGIAESVHFDNQVYSFSRCDVVPYCICRHRYFATLMWLVEGTILAAVTVVVVTTAAVLTLAALVIATRVVAAALAVATISRTAAVSTSVPLVVTAAAFLLNMMAKAAAVLKRFALLGAALCTHSLL